METMLDISKTFLVSETCENYSFISLIFYYSLLFIRVLSGDPEAPKFREERHGHLLGARRGAERGHGLLERPLLDAYTVRKN